MTTFIITSPGLGRSRFKLDECRPPGHEGGSELLHLLRVGCRGSCGGPPSASRIRRSCFSSSGLSTSIGSAPSGTQKKCSHSSLGSTAIRYRSDFRRCLQPQLLHHHLQILPRLAFLAGV